MRVALALALVAAPGWAASIELPPGAVRAVEEFTPLASYAVPTAPWTEATGLPTDEAEGRLVREAWQMPGRATTLQILEPLRAQLLEQGYDILFECETRQCGGFDFRFDTEVIPEPDMHVDLADFRFLSAKLDTDLPEWVTLMVSRSSAMGYVQFVRVTPPGPADQVVSTKSPDGLGVTLEPPPTPVTALDPAETGDIATDLDGRGRAILGDLSFETGSSRLAGGDFPSLDALATYLRTHPGRKVTLVGHTDASGSLDANIALSRARARAVLEKLVADYDIPSSQLGADGVGYLMPLASNLTEEGRARNRRVEVVMTSTE